MWSPAWTIAMFYCVDCPNTCSKRSKRSRTQPPESLLWYQNVSLLHPNWPIYTGSPFNNVWITKCCYIHSRRWIILRLNIYASCYSHTYPHALWGPSHTTSWKHLPEPQNMRTTAHVPSNMLHQNSGIVSQSISGDHAPWMSSKRTLRLTYFVKHISSVTMCKCVYMFLCDIIM